MHFWSFHGSACLHCLGVHVSSAADMQAAWTTSLWTKLTLQPPRCQTPQKQLQRQSPSAQPQRRSPLC